MGASTLSIFLTLRGQGFFEANEKSGDIEDGNILILIIFREPRSYDNLYLHTPFVHILRLCLQVFIQIYD